MEGSSYRDSTVFVKMIQWKFRVHVGSLPLLIVFSSTTVSSDMLKLGFDSFGNKKTFLNLILLFSSAT